MWVLRGAVTAQAFHSLDRCTSIAKNLVVSYGRIAAKTCQPDFNLARRATPSGRVLHALTSIRPSLSIKGPQHQSKARKCHPQTLNTSATIHSAPTSSKHCRCMESLQISWYIAGNCRNITGHCTDQSRCNMPSELRTLPTSQLIRPRRSGR